VDTYFGLLSGMGRVGLDCGDDIPWQKLPDPVDRMLCDRGQDRTQIKARINSIQFSGGDETVEGRSAFAT
jgi:hypothetical protein